MTIHLCHACAAGDEYYILYVLIMHLICLYAIVFVIYCIVGVLMLHMIYSNVHVAFVPVTA